MASRSADFNYKVALASGLKSLQGGRLRQAEEQFRYLVQHFPAADGGYRGLAKVLVEQEDRAAALRILLDGGAALAKAGERTGAIGLYKESVALDAHDLTAHRRLAAALTLAGETDEAAREYVRFITAALSAGDRERAKLEAAYALERFPGSTEIADAARAAGAEAPAEAEPAEAAPLSSEERDALMRSAFGGAPAAAAPVMPSQSWETTAPASWETPAKSDAWAAPQPAPASDAWQAPAPAAESWGAPAPAAAAATDGDGVASDADTATVEATAARYLAKRDPRGGEHALEAARRHIAEGRLHAASDLLLQLIAAGIVDHEAQRLLVDVTMSLGRKDVAKAKVQLLVEALRLDGRAELAAEVEQLAQAL